MPLAEDDEPSQTLVLKGLDQQLQQSLRLYFETYERTGTAMAVVKFFHEEGLQFPRKLQRGARKGENVWGELEHRRSVVKAIIRVGTHCES